MAKGTSNFMKLGYFLAVTFGLWYMLNKTALGAEFADEMLTLGEGIMTGAGEGLRSPSY